MIHFETSTQISRPRDKVFDFLTDIEGLPRWQTGIVQSQRLTQGEFRVGSQFKENAKVGPWKLQTTCSVTDLKLNERFAFEAKSTGPLDYEGYFELQPVSGGTRLTLKCRGRLKGLWRLMQPVLSRGLRRETRAELATMKRLLEAGPA